MSSPALGLFLDWFLDNETGGNECSDSEYSQEDDHWSAMGDSGGHFDADSDSDDRDATHNTASYGSAYAYALKGTILFS